MSYICRDCKFNIIGALPDPPRCPDCGSMYLLQDKKKLQKLKDEVRRLAHLRKNKQDPITFYDRLFSSFFVVLIGAATLFFGPFLSFLFRSGASNVEDMAGVYKFIFEWWPSMLFGAAIIGFIFDIDKVSNFFGYIWGTIKQNEEVIMLLTVFFIAAISFAFVFQLN